MSDSKKYLYLYLFIGLFIGNLIIPTLVFDNIRSIGWKKIGCTVEKNFVAAYKPSQKATYATKYKIVLRYSYYFENKKYSGSDNYYGFNSQRAAEMALADIIEGPEIMCYVNPARPSESLVFRMGDISFLLLALLSVFLFIVNIGGLFMTLNWNKIRPYFYKEKP